MLSRSAKNRIGINKSQHTTRVLFVFLFVGGLFLALITTAYAAMSSWLKDLPDYNSADAFNLPLPTVVYASDQKTILARFQLEAREPVPIDQVSHWLIDAVIATEDARFYEHGGVDYYGIMRAFVNNIKGGGIQGASTITQQFVRNTILADEMDDISIKRKTREIFLAFEIEKRYSKTEILQMYLNSVNFGAGAHGVEIAARRYYSKRASDLTLAEAALIAGIPQSPTYNDPFIYPDQALKRRNIVLERMYGEHMISREEFNSAIQEPLNLHPRDIDDDGIIAYPYFASYVRSLLYNEFDLSESDILKGGLKVYTTLDVDKQKDAEMACERKKNSMGRESMEVAMAVVDPESGNVQAIVGGSDYKKSQVNLATGQGGGGRPCGSVFKTFTLVESIKRAIDPNSTYVDCTSPATIDGYKLENYGNTNYGTKTIAGAFAVSSNTGFVRLISALGVKSVAQTAHDLGVTSNLHEDTAGATLTLGVENVTPLELANAMATLANGGIRHELCAVSTIVGRDGNVIVDNSNPSTRARRVLSPQQARAIQKVMQGVVTGGTGTAAALGNGQVVAGKTGTSEDYKDISFVGYTPFIAAAIWVGDPTNVSSVPTGTAGDVFKWYATSVMSREDITKRDFSDADAGELEYQKFTNSDYHITAGYSSYYSSSSSGNSSSNNNSNNTSSGNRESTPQSSPQSQSSSSKKQQSSSASASKKKQT